jgi:hypothetical protein
MISPGSCFIKRRLLTEYLFPSRINFIAICFVLQYLPTYWFSCQLTSKNDLLLPISIGVIAICSPGFFLLCIPKNHWSKSTILSRYWGALARREQDTHLPVKPVIVSTWESGGVSVLKAESGLWPHRASIEPAGAGVQCNTTTGRKVWGNDKNRSLAIYGWKYPRIPYSESTWYYWM